MTRSMAFFNIPIGATWLAETDLFEKTLSSSSYRGQKCRPSGQAESHFSALRCESSFARLDLRRITYHNKLFSRRCLFFWCIQEYFLISIFFIFLFLSLLLLLFCSAFSFTYESIDLLILATHEFCPGHFHLCSSIFIGGQLDSLWNLCWLLPCA